MLIRHFHCSFGNLPLLLKISQWNSFEGVNCVLNLDMSSFPNISHLNVPPVSFHLLTSICPFRWASWIEAETTPKPLFSPDYGPLRDPWEALIQLRMTNFPWVLSILSQPPLWWCDLSTISSAFGSLRCQSGPIHLVPQSLGEIYFVLPMVWLYTSPP